MKLQAEHLRIGDRIEGLLVTGVRRFGQPRYFQKVAMVEVELRQPGKDDKYEWRAYDLKEFVEVTSP